MPEKGQHVSPNDDMAGGPSCFTAGWGSTGKTGEISNKLKSIQVKIFSGKYCLKKSDYTEDVLNVDVSFCAGYMNGDKDACQERDSQI